MYPKWNRNRIVYKWENDILRIGSEDDDVQELIGFSDKWIEIISILDGKKELKEVIPIIVKISETNEEIAKSFIDKFCEYNFIDMLPKKYNENDEEYEYYRAVITYFSSHGLGGYKFYEKLKNMKITILGCGAGGSNIAFHLSQLGVGNIHIVDPDYVDYSNLNRQALFTYEDIGKLKVYSFKKNLQNKNPYVKVTTNAISLNNVSDIENEIKNSDWVFCCMDEPPYIAQRLVNFACLNSNIPSVYCFSQKNAGKYFMVNPNVSGCVDCLLEKNDNDNFKKLVKIFIENSSDLWTAMTENNMTYMTTWIVNKWLKEIVNPNIDNYNKLFRLSFDDGSETIHESWIKSETCPTCGKIKNNSSLWNILSIEK